MIQADTEIGLLLLLWAPAVTVGETEGAMDRLRSVFTSSFAYNFVRK